MGFIYVTKQLLKPDSYPAFLLYLIKQTHLMKLITFLSVLMLGFTSVNANANANVKDTTQFPITQIVTEAPFVTALRNCLQAADMMPLRRFCNDSIDFVLNQGGKSTTMICTGVQAFEGLQYILNKMPPATAELTTTEGENGLLVYTLDFELVNSKDSLIMIFFMKKGKIYKICLG
jgi:hypothetical protein